MRKVLFVNSLSGGFQTLVSTLLVFTVIPVFMHKLGTELFGVFSLVLLIGNLNLFVNLGFNTSLVKFLSEQGKCQESDYDVFVTALLLCLVILPVTVVGIVFNKFVLMKILCVPLKYINGDTEALYDFLMISNFFLFIGQIPSSIIDSCQKIYINNLAQMFYNFSYWGLTLFFVAFFPGLRFVGLGILITSSLWLISLTLFSRKIWGKLVLNDIYINFFRVARKQISYSSKLYFSGMISFFYEPLTKVLISRFIGISEVGYFDIALRVRNQLWNFISKMLYPVFPLISSMMDNEKTRNLIHDLEQKLAYLMIPIIVTFGFISRPFVTIWLGKNIDLISTSFVFIVSGFMIGIIVVPCYMFLQTKDHPGKTIILQLVNVCVNGVVFLVFYRIWGYYAAILSNLAAILSSFIGTLYYQKKFLNSLIFDSWVQFGKLISIFIVMCLTGVSLNFVFSSNYIKLICMPSFLAIEAILLYRYLRVFSESDIARYLSSGGCLKKMICTILIY